MEFDFMGDEYYVDVFFVIGVLLCGVWWWLLLWLL